MSQLKRADEILASIKTFPELEVLVVGDFFLDQYVEGEMFEISKEGPIPVVRFESRLEAAGAAGNLASSIRTLGARVRTVGIVGDDANGRTLLRELEEKGIETAGMIVHPSRPTLTYTKFRARVENAPSREILRLDVLPDGPLAPELEQRTIEACARIAAGVDAIVVLDQIHHLITRRLLEELPELARRQGALLHGSSREHIGDFRDFDLIIPNDLEANAALGGDPSNPLPLQELGEGLKREGGHRQVLLTLGPDGMALFPTRGGVERIPTFAEEVVDVTGAGDAVAAAAALGNILGWDLMTIAWTASQSAAIAISRVGTHHVTREELEEAVRDRWGPNGKTAGGDGPARPT